jgi:hypothetical protein
LDDLSEEGNELKVHNAGTDLQEWMGLNEPEMDSEDGHNQ